MVYTAWSVVFGEQPSAAKWNILGANDASFNDGTGIATNAITAAKLATNAITLGYAERTSNFTTTTAGSLFDITSLSVAVTIPAGGRRIEIHVHSQLMKSSQGAGNGVLLNVCEDGTELNRTVHSTPISNYAQSADCFATKVATAGAHTYKAQGKQDAAGTYTLEGGATYPAYIIVKAI